ncbi:MAG: MFS transporter [Oscillospiraceae bacterium]|nr:MFS transporter [Oscillospiraceae bacterium]
MYGSPKDIRHNLKMFVMDGISFMPSLALISITAVIPFFLDQLGATTFQIALATATTLICALLTQPLFGVIASHSTVMNRTFGKILFLQRLIFLLFILLIPVFSGANALLVNLFLIFWAIFNLFAGSYAVFHTPLVIKLLPPDKRGTIRGIGFAIGSFIGVGMSALIPVILLRIVFPYNFMIIFSLGLFFLLVNASIFFFMRQSKDVAPNEPMGLSQFIQQMPTSIRENPSFRAMILTCLFLAIANAVLPYYTLYAIRVFSATEAHIALLTGLAILSGAIAYVGFGYVADRYGPRIIAIIAAGLAIAAGALALTTHSLNFLFVAWVLANMNNNGFPLVVTLLLGEVSPSAKIPLYVGVHTTISMALSTVVVLLLAPALENIGFIPLFALVLACGLGSLLANVFLLKKRLANLSLT